MKLSEIQVIRVITSDIVVLGEAHVVAIKIRMMDLLAHIHDDRRRIRKLVMAPKDCASYNIINKLQENIP